MSRERLPTCHEEKKVLDESMIRLFFFNEVRAAIRSVKRRHIPKQNQVARGKTVGEEAARLGVGSHVFLATCHAQRFRQTNWQGRCQLRGKHGTILS